MAAEGQEAETPFIKNLASSDRKLRESSLASLRAFLSAQRRPLSPLAVRKLWKGLYYALYMTDRPAAQARFAADLASLLPGPLPSSSRTGAEAARAAWYAGFWDVLGERWPHVDALRMDKFMLLVRRVLAAQLSAAAASASSPANGAGAVEAVLVGYPLEPEGDLRACPLGLRLHVLDIWVDELERAGLLGAAEHEPLVRRLADAVEALGSCRVKQVRARAAESLADARLPWNDSEEENSNEGEESVGQKGGDDDDEWGGIDD
ncbi:hypothetical protein N3K66_006206 [Trichothecium roseum]|uniref:Uncharacterized protein n=1 Tax=Trichothecium roseum TaxID=47278 RepID=A0ACC0V1V0_9HYPO|nr:hypothetical protein N3K66_006206 [Trichothecium roseum]